MFSTDQNNIENVLNALADTTRIQLLNLLVSRGQATATTLATEVPVTRQAVVKHLNVLNEAGLVTSNRVGREVRYTVCPWPLTTTADWIRKLAADWDKKLDSIKQVAEATNKSDRA